MLLPKRPSEVKIQLLLESTKKKIAWGDAIFSVRARVKEDKERVSLSLSFEAIG
jgi:hypothetical protein